MMHNVILLIQFALVYLLTNFLQIWSLEIVCIHKSYIVYFEISVVPIDRGFSFIGRGNVMENQCWKRGGTLGKWGFGVSESPVHSDATYCQITSVIITYCDND